MDALSVDKQGNCVQSSIHKFPPYLTGEPTRWEFVIIALLLICYLFTMLAVVCDEYFVPAVERMCARMNISYAVGGASFLAVITSVPELCITTLSTFFLKDDIGASTMVASCIFNSLAITGFTGLLVKKEGLFLDWWPLSRESFWYMIASLLLWMVMYNGMVEWYETIILLCMYLLYVSTLIWDSELQNVLRGKTTADGTRPTPKCLKCFVAQGQVADRDPDNAENLWNIDEAEELENVYNPCKFPSEGSFIDKILWIIVWPAQLLFFLTIPNVRTWGDKVVLLSTVMCCLWILAISWFSTWFLTVVGYHLYIPDSVMANTLLAAGAGLPELVSNIIVTRKGYGSMGIANSLGSNVFNIFVCLALPWFVRCMMIYPKPIDLDSDGFIYYSFFLFISLVWIYVIFMIARFRLGCEVGILALFAFIAYIVVSTCMEFNLFGQVRLKTCN